MADKYEVAVIGGGPGGYVAAIKAAQLGKKTVCIEREYWGGVCLNWGCIPSKALIHAAHVFEETTGHAMDMGIDVGGKPKLDSKRLDAWKQGVVQKMTSGVAQLLKGNKVAMVMGNAVMTGPRTIEVTSKDGKKTIEADDVIIAVGARPIQLPGFEFDEVQICSARGGVNVETIPKTMTIVGAGVIGLELGTVYAKLGTQVTVLEFMPQAMTGIDADLVRPVQRRLDKLGVKFVFNAKAKGAKKTGKTVEVTYEVDGKTQTITSEKVLVAVSFQPNTEKIGLDKAGVKTDAKGFIPVNDKLQTNVPRVYAIGDCTGSPLLAHRAMKQGEVAAEVIAGHKGAAYDVKAMPGGAFTDPEIATVGLTEAKAKEAGYDPLVGKFFFGANGRAVASGQGEGFVKAVVDRKTHVLLGIHIVGPSANDLAAEAALAIELGALADDLALTVHVHPTLSECVHEACKAALGEAIHALNRSAA